MLKVLRTARFFVLSLGLITSVSAFAAEDSWQKINENEVKGTSPRYIKPTKAGYFQLDVAELKSEFLTAPMEEKGKLANYGKVLTLPMPDGSFQKFAFARYLMMEPGLVGNWPEVYTFSGQGIDDPTATVKVDFTPLGFHSQILREQVSVYIDPVFHGETQFYQVYTKNDLDRSQKGTFTEWGLESEEEHAVFDKSGKPNPEVFASGGVRRQYRLAVACTGEYTTFHGGATNAASAITTTINRVNGVYEKEICVRLNLVANNNLLIYTTAASDPYTNNNGSTMLGQNQTTVNNVIGTANYDMGHVFSTGGGGIASLGSVCVAARKAQGVTGSSSPVGDPFDIDYVAHEMGHQFGGNHTFNATTGSCGGGNRNANTAYEPGSGSTIQSYAGICGSAADLQPNSDDYYVFISYQEMTSFTTTGSGNTCAVQIQTGNTPPTIPTPTGGFVLPISTPFKLTAPQGVDADGDALTYCWEENDLGAAGSPASPAGNAPIFRTFKGTTSRDRYFPKLSNTIAGNTTIGERLPTYARNLNFKLTVRDNRAGGGGVNSTTMNMTVVATAGPFVVNSPNTNSIIWEGGSTQTVTWAVANTAAAPVNSPKVRILLSTDGGNTYPHVLIDSTNNDGSQAITVPFVESTTCRVMVASYSNVFFDISNANFRINPPSTASIPFTVADTAVCPGQNFKIAFDPTGGPTTYLNGNVFSVQLSNAAGAFTSPTTIGTKQTVGADTILCMVPASVAAGNSYKLRIVSSNPVRTSIQVVNAPRIRPMPANPGTIAGPAAFCPNVTGQVFQVPDQNNIIGFQWTTPPGAFITSSPADSNVIVVDMGTQGGEVTVNAVNGCGAGPVSVLAVSPIIVLPAQITVSTQNTTICEGTSVQFSSTSQNGGLTPQYQWLKNGEVIPNANSTTYTATNLVNGDKISSVLVSSLSCSGPNVDTSNVLTMTVTPLRTPIATVEANTLNDTTCAGEAVTFTVTPTFGGATPAYQWYKNTAAILGATQNSYSVSNLVTGDSIRVRLTSNASCLSTSIVFSNAIKLKVMTLSASAGADTSFCEGSLVGPLTFTGTPAGGTWTGNGVSGSGSFSGVAPAVYALTYTVNRWGCSRTDGKTVTIKAMPVFSLGNDVNVCKTAAPFAPNGQTGLTCTGSGFSGGLFNPSTLPAGPAQLICAKTLNGCTKADTVVFNILAVDTVIYSVTGNTLTASANNASSYQWYLGANPINGATNSTYDISATGIYCVEVLFANGCKRKSVCANQIYTSVSGKILSGALLVFPNPATSELNIQSQPFSGKRAEVSIINSLGQVIKVEQTVFTEKGITLPLTDLAAGFYTLRVIEESGKSALVGFVKQ